MDENLLQQQISEWVQDNIELVSAENPVTMHVDRLRGVDLARERIIPTSLEILKALVLEVQCFNDRVKAGLVLPLKAYNKKINTKHPVDLDGLQYQLLSREPPSIYLVSWTSSRKFYRTEEYRCPIDFLPLDDYHDNLYVYYQENRGRIGIQNNWEFAKGIFIEYCPDGVFDY